MEQSEQRLSFRLAPPEGETIALAAPVPHPWRQGEMLTVLGVYDDLPGYQPMREANDRLARLMAGAGPESLLAGARAKLAARVHELFDELLTPEQVQFHAYALFSGRTVLAPVTDVRLDQVGLAEEIAWTLFSPLLAREVGRRAIGTQQGGDAGAGCADGPLLGLAQPGTDLYSHRLAGLLSRCASPSRSSA